jgi:hypothetical protein
MHAREMASPCTNSEVARQIFKTRFGRPINDDYLAREFKRTLREAGFADRLMRRNPTLGVVQEMRGPINLMWADLAIASRLSLSVVCTIFDQYSTRMEKTPAFATCSVEHSSRETVIAQSR